jgi:aspartyl/glutamyl-tRNA(Asn/Gln) amidotransferase C subunit
MCSEMETLIDFAQGLSELDTKDIEYIVVQDIQNVLADDVQGEEYDLKKFLANAPEIKDDYFVVPKVID